MPIDELSIKPVAFLLADYAEIVNNKLYTMGAGWDRLSLPEGNLTYRAISFGVVLRVPWTAANQRHTWELRLTNDDGKDMLDPSPSGEFETGRPAGSIEGAPSNMMFAFTLANYTFPSVGSYSARLSVDGSEIATAPFAVVAVKQQ